MEAGEISVPTEVIAILEQFPAVFKNQIQLPPERSQVHHIKLFPNHGTINVRPYRYPHHQKEEIEKQVTELLQAGVIRPSMSAFSSPVLSVLLENCFIANQAKCKFGCKQIDYLGHIISGKGVAVDPAKVRCILDWPEPKNVKGVRGFLGLTGYYRKFIKDYGKVAKPLTELTKKDNFAWGTEANAAFQLMKIIMTSPPDLVLPNFSLPFEVECDAAGRGIGAVLMQQRKPVAFFSKALSQGNLAKSVYEKERMALVLCIQHWRHYLLGKQFRVYTDHKSLKHFLQQRITSPDQQCWLAKLLGYQFEVKYKPGMDNKAADALSRRDDDADLGTLISYPQWTDSKKNLDEVKDDPKIQDMIQTVLSAPDSKPGYSVKQGVLFYHGRLVLSPKSPSIPLLLEEFHCIPTGGHSGFLRTYRKLADNLYWLGMQKSVREFVRACDICQRQKHPPSILRFLSNETKVVAVALELNERDEALTQLKSHLQRAQEQMASYADKKRRDVRFQVGEWVLFKLRPHRQQSMVKRINKKLAARFYRPFKVIAKVGEVAYRLQLPDQSRIHPVFHVSLLKKAVGDYQVLGELPKDLELTDDSDVYPEKVMGSRVTMKGGVTVQQSLIKWRHKTWEDVTWEDNAVLQGQFPDFCLEDKAVSMEAGIDRKMDQVVGLDSGPKPKVWRVYKRSKRIKEIIIGVC
ncbi:hypothetical protein KIW84_032089 [Lathyrus oleraceus]|uniref:Uncharacterized protein n=2 Tax=Pisum sativum TaxID=3888 RepID=A0A9D5AY94_PEA|nr:hypothetical protein KIW84_032089 [Pisum sativum]